ncbi:MAG: hypothetical protein IH602_00195 [Bryobacteraceae bacterium]|nr:hypothetical protein [Bryobacteraceae bacterium]
MTLEEAQYSYQAWRGQLDAGLIHPDQFRAAVSQIQATDATGTPWMVDPDSGVWLRWNGASWESGQTYGYQPPPVAPPPPPAYAASQQAYPPAPPPGTVAYGYSQPSPYATQSASAQDQPQKTPWSQRIWDILSVAGSSAMAGAWYWYSSLDPYVKPDYKTCAAMVLLPILLIVFREKIDGWLQPLQPFREKMPRMVMLGAGAATPLLVSNFLYASGSSNYPYMLRTYLISTIVSYVILRQPPRGAGGLSTSRIGGQI